VNARILCCLAWCLAGVLTLVNPTFAQDSAASDASAMLKQGLAQYKALEFAPAKAILLKVDASALTPADKKALDDSLAKVDDAIKQQSQARDAFAKAEEALKGNDLAKAKENYAQAAASEYLTQAERKDAAAQLAQVDQRLKANAATTLAEKPQAPATAAAPAATQDAEVAAAAGADKVTTKPSADALDAVQANRSQKARELLAEGKAALDDNKPDVAVVSLERAVALSPNDAQAQTLLEQARALLAKQTPSDKTVLSSLEESRKVSRQVSDLEFAKAISLSNERLTDAKTIGDFDAAMTAARSAQRQLEDKKELFTPKEYSDKTIEVSNQVAFVTAQKADWVQRRDAQAQQEAQLRDNERIAAQDQQRREKISSLNERAKTLASEQKYAEAIDIYEQVLKIDARNSEAAYQKDKLQQTYMLREEGNAHKDRDIESQKLGIGMREAEVPWNVLVNYPKDWQEMTVRRKGSGAGESNESEEDRAVRQQLKTKAPEFIFDNQPFEEVVKFFHNVSGANFNVNWTALQNGNIDRTTPVNLRLNNVSVEKALQLVLSNLSTSIKLSYVIDGGVVTISSKDDLAKSPVIQVYDIRDLLFVVKDFPGGQISLGSGGGDGGSATINNSSTNSGNTVNRAQMVTQITNTIIQTIDPNSWAPLGTTGSIQELNGTLIVTQTMENQEKLAELIAKLRETRALQITVEARFISVSTSFLSSIGVDLDMFFNIGSSLGSSSNVDPYTGATAYNTSGSSGWGSSYSGNNNVTPIGVVQNGTQQEIGWGNMLGVGTGIGHDVTTPSMSVGGSAFLDDIQVDFLVQATQASASTRTLIAPRLTLFNGMEANIQNGNLLNYISELTFVPGTGGAAGSTVSGGYTATIETLQLLTTLDVIAVVSADRRYVTMQLTPSIQSLNSMTNFPLGNNGDFVQLPDVQVSAISTIVTVPDGGTLLLGGQRNMEEIERESGTPGLDKIPVLNRLFSSRGKIREEKTLLILVRPKIIIPREEEDKAFPPTE
jgi:type II secretory pathway component GspD/PulD (secretin)